VAVLTETTTSMLASDWEYVVHGKTGFYPGNPADGAKVAIVSRFPMQPVEVAAGAPIWPANLAVADVEHPAGTVRVIGVVVRYDEKRAFIEGLPAVLEQAVTDRTVLAGDFNYALPAGGLAARLEGALDAAGLRVVTAGPHEELGDERPLLDHIAASSAFEVSGLTVWPRRDFAYRNGEVEVSDHAGVIVSLRSRHGS